MSKVTVGEVYREDDNRDFRFVLVTAVHRDDATIITCDCNGVPIPGRRYQCARLNRFGKSGGYHLWLWKAIE
jgi:hypothetical protein